MANTYLIKQHVQRHRVYLTVHQNATHAGADVVRQVRTKKVRAAHPRGGHLPPLQLRVHDLGFDLRCLGQSIVDRKDLKFDRFTACALKERG